MSEIVKLAEHLMDQIGWGASESDVIQILKDFQAARAPDAQAVLPYGAISAYNEAKDGCAEFRNMEIPCRLVAEMVEALLYTHPAKPESQWIRCDERLPTKADQDFHECVWTLFEDGEIELHEAQEVVDTWDDDYGISHWMPTSLKRPNPPTNQESGDE